MGVFQIAPNGVRFYYVWSGFPIMLFAPNHSAAAQIFIILKFLSLVSFSGKRLFACPRNKLIQIIKVAVNLF